MQIRFKNYFLKNKKGIARSIGTFLFLILIFPSMIGAIITSQAERAEIVRGVLNFSSINPTLISEYNSNFILPGDPPIANLDTVSVLQGTSVSGNVLLNDSDPDGDVLILNTTPIIAPAYGTVTINADGTFTYLPYPFFVGTDEFTYEICDGEKADVTDNYDNQTNVTITPFGTPTVSSTITVTSGGTITDVNIPNLFIEHSYTGDVVITLTSPSGTVVTLVDQYCDEENFDIGFDDESSVPYSSMPCPPDEGTMNQPYEALSLFDGENSIGDWVLTIHDVEFNDGGFLDFWELEITTLGAAAGTNCVTATVTALVYSSSTEICNNNIDDDGDGLVDVYDPDCPCDDGNFLGLCDPQCEYFPPVTPSFGIEIEWASEDSVNTFTPVIGADLDGDASSVEILGFKKSTTTYVENALFIIDGATGLTKYEFNSKTIHLFNKGLAFGDVDKDGNGEIYYMIGNGDVNDYRKIACYEYNPAGTNLGGTGTGSFDLQWVSDQRVACGMAYPFNTVTDNYAVNLADFNNDGFPEVYVGNEIFDAITGTRLATGGANNIGNNIYNFYLHEHFHANTVAVDALPDGDCTNCNGLELVAGNQVYSVNLTTGVMTVERELSSAPGHQDGPVSIADYDLDGDVDGIITTTDEDGSYVYIWDLQTETMIGNAHTITNVNINSIWYRSASNATIADFDGDNKPEIGVCANYVFQVIEDYQFDISGTGGVAWSLVTTDRSGMTGATSFDFNADGLTEVVYRDENDLRIISGASGINLSTFPCGSRTGGEYPIVLDIDNDNETELVCSCADESYARNGRIRAFKSQDYPWVPTRNIWNQYAYFITNVNDDLSIPPVQQPHHKVGSPAPGTTGRLNSFLKQVGPYNNEGEPIFPAADIFVNILAGGPTGCVLGDSIDINLRFYNNGDLSYPAGIPFAIYEGNPETTGTLVDTFEIQTAIIPGDSVDFSITLPIAGLTSPFHLFIIGNDDGTLALPLDLENDFPATTIGECDFSNNIDSILIGDCETEAPVLIGVPDDVTIECDETVSIPTVTATDNCSSGLTVMYSFDENGDSCSRTINRTWTVTDDCGNVSIETQTITIQDTEAPHLLGVPSNTTVDCNDQFPVIPNVTATDNCSGIMSITYDTLLTSGNCPYSVTRTWTATDSCNNSTTESYTIYVIDEIDPIINGVPSNITVECTEIPEVPDVTVSDNCDNDIELTYEDVYLPNGNYENNTEATVPASGRTWDINVNGYGGLEANNILSFDLSFILNQGKGRAEFVLINPSGQGIFLVGEYCTGGDCEATEPSPLIWNPTFTRCDTGNPQWNNDDPIPTGAGNFTPHGSTPSDPILGVTEYVDCFEDFTGPMNGQWQLYARKNQTMNGSLRFRSFSFNLGNHSCLDEGTILRTWTATDDCGNTTVASQTITLEDTTPPVVNAYVADTTVACRNDVPSIPNLTITDCDDNATIIFQGETGSGDCEYEIVRTWLATDNCGNDTLLTQTITVNDTIAPVLDSAPADITISCEDDIPNPAELEATDNCWDDVDVDFSEYMNTDVCPFILRRVWIAIDECDNVDSVEQIITIIDDTPPAITGIPDDIILDCQDCLQSFQNGGFEDNPVTGNWAGVHESQLPGWDTDASDNRIEIQRSGQINGVVSYEGDWHAELNHINNGDLYQTFCVIPTTILQISFAHRHRPAGGNTSDDIMGVYTGPDLNNLTLYSTIVGERNAGWKVHNVNYSVPVGETEAVFLFRAIQGSPNSISIGNLIDDINIITIPGTNIIPSVTDNCSEDVSFELSETKTENNCANNYRLVRTWTAIDDCGNIAVDSQTIIVGDFISPEILGVPQDTIVDCHDIPDAAIINMATDNCGSEYPVSFLEEIIEGDCPSSYTILRTWTTEDDCGNISVDTQTVIVEDNDDPILIDLPNDVTVDCNSIPTVANVTVSDNCTSNVEVVFSENISTGCPYTITRTWTASDSCNNAVTGTQTITVEDNILPILDNVPADVTVECNAIPAAANVTANDNCTPNVEVVFFENISTGCPYTITRTWTANDSCNNVITETQVITVEDNILPVLDNVPVDVTIECDAIPVAANVTANDNCTPNIAVVFFENISTGCPYTITRTWTASDSCNNVVTATQIITVEDNADPVLDNVPDDVTVECDAIPAAANVTANDNCTPNIEVVFSENISTGCPYTITRTWTASDSCNNVVTATQIITVEDNTDPILIDLPNDVTVDCSSIPDIANVTATDNCTSNIAVIFSENISTGCPYTITRTWTASDSCNNIVTATQIITVEDNNLPVLAGVPSDITVDCDEILGEALVTAQDDCAGTLPVIFNEVVGTGCPYTITRTWTAIDSCDNEVIGTQVVTLIDNENPVFGNVPNDVTVECDAIPDTANVTAFDNCTSIVDITFTEVTTTGCPYTITRRWVAVDDCQNIDSVVQVITVEDTVVPVFANVPEDATVECDAIPAVANVTASDNCLGNMNVEFSETRTYGCPYFIARVWAATDSCGNETIASQLITVEDNTLPTLNNVPDDVTVDCASIPDTTIVTANDNCTPNAVVIFSENISTGCPYTITRTWTVSDSCNNVVTESQVITVEDNDEPTFANVPTDVTVDCSSIPAVENVIANDNCDTDIDIAFTEIVGNGCPYEVTRKWVATDDCGNMDSIIQVITVEDTTLPVLSNVPINVTVECDAIPTPANVTATDDCLGNMDVEFTEVIGTGCPYTIIRTWTVEDSCNNTVTRTQIITVEDTTAPTFANIPNDVTVNCSTIPDTANIIITDNCDENINIVFSEISQTTDCPYTITRKWVATDNCGNADSIIQVIHVDDNTFPVLVGVPSNETVECDAIPTPPIVTASDMCAGDLIVVFEESVGTGCPYTIIRTWRAIDPCNNMVIEQQVITVEDNTLPTLSGVPNDVTVNCDAIPDTAIVTASDNCTPDVEIIFTENISNGCPYTITRTWTAVDSCGNTFSQSQIITVNDNELPNLVGVPDDVTVNCEMIPPPANVTIIDDCWNNLTPVLNEVTSSGCPYTITRTWTATDSCGNSVSASQILTVEDEEGPIIETPPADITLDCADPIPPAVELTATDNCSGEEENGVFIVEDIDFSEVTTGDCPIIITRTWTAYDECDNESTVSQTITIEDTTAPTLFNIPNDMTLDCSEVADTQQVVATDDCDNDLEIVFEETYSDTTCQNTFTITRTWTFTDDCGNEISHIQNIQIQDTIAPVFTDVPAGMMIPCDSVPEMISPVATDNCSDVVVTFEEVEMPGDCIDLRLMTRTWTAVDACGNESSVSQNIIFNNCSPDATVTMTPANIVCEGTEVVFEVTLTAGYDTPFYQWQFSTDGMTWIDIVGENGSTFTLIAEGANTGSYQVIVANDPSDINDPLCSITSNAQVLEVIDLDVEMENLELEICQGDSIEVGGSIYFEAGNFTDTLNAISGCDSTIINLNLIVNDIYTITVDSTICEGESVMVGGTVYSQNGTYVNNLNSSEGCDSIVTLNLTVNPVAQIIVDEYLCEGQNVTIGNSTYDETGTYVDTLLSSLGCDSIITLNLVIDDILEITLEEDICPGESFVVGSSIYNQTGIYQDTLTTQDGCDSLVILNLTVHEEYEDFRVESICEGQELIVGDSTYTTTGNYFNVLQTINGCDSIINVNLTVNENYSENIVAEICDGQSYEVGDSTYTTSGTFTTNMTTAEGCDSVIILDLTIHEIYSENIVAEICDGQSYEIGDSTYMTSGTFTTNMTTAEGCDSVIILDLTVHEIYSENIVAEICDGQSYEVGDSTYTTSGIFTTNIPTVNGCDSVIVLDLTVHEIYSENIVAEICEGQSYEVGDSTYTTSGIFTTNIPTVNGCDSVIILDLTIHEIYSENIVAEICEGQSYEVGDSTYTTSGTFTTNIPTMNGCDSIITLDLTVHEIYSENIIAEICDGQNYEVGDSTYTTSGIFTTNMMTAEGCDSVIILDLTVHEIYSENIVGEICDGQNYEVGDSTYTTSGIFITNIPTVNGCDSIITLDLTVNETYSIDLIAESCEGTSYEVGDSVYTTTGIYTTILTSLEGCDSIVILDLTVHENYSENIVAEICDGQSYEVGDSTYMASGIFTTNMTTAEGCDSVIILDLTVHEIYSENVIAEICEGQSYEVGDSSYTTSGIFTTNLTTVNGCDSIVTLDLSVNPIYSNTIFAEICEGENYIIGDSTYSDSGIFNQNYQTIDGCDSIVILDLTVHPTYSNIISEFICTGQNFIVGDSIYTETGTYSNTLQSIAGCDSIITLNLTVDDVLEIDLVENICEGDSIEMGGVYYNQTGVYSNTAQSSNGCDSIVTLTLTVFDHFATSMSEVICEGQSFEIGDSSFTTSGIYLVEMHTIHGCDSIVTLDLTVNSVDSIFINDAICEGQNYTVGDSTYTATGIYQVEFLNTNGCDSIVTLDLVVNTNEITNLAGTICEGSNYVVGDSTYTTSGIYTTVLTSVAGCDSTVILDLTVEDEITNTIEAEICFGENYVLGDSTYAASGIYQQTYTTSSGCDSTITLDLTILEENENSIVASICEGSSYIVGDSTYTTSGIYTTVLTSVAGCDSTVILDLAITDMITEDQFVTICSYESYQFGNEIITESGLYSDTLISMGGCDSIINLDLTVLFPIEATIHATICTGDLYTLGDTSYQTPGVYEQAFVANSGCDSLVTLHLSVVPNFQVPISATLCANDFFQVGDSLYNQSGMYIDTLSSITGCDSIIMLNLNILPYEEATIEATICAGEIYQIGNNAYNTSGVYSDTLTSINGCDSITNLVLEVSDVQPTIIYQNLCEGDSIILAGAYQTTGGIFTDVLQSVHGCDSLIHTYVTLQDNATTYMQEVICEGDSIFIAGTYQFGAGEFTDTLSTIEGCDSIIVTELMIDSATDIYVEGLELCLGEEGQLFVEGADVVTWSPTVGLSCDDCPNPIVSPSSTTTYTVSTAGCLGTTVEASVTVYVNTPPELVVSDDETILLGESAFMMASTDDMQDVITWSDGIQTICENCRELTVTPEKTTTYYITIVDELGCAAMEEITINVNEACQYSRLQIPNMISPNGDGYNDRFEIRHEGFGQINLLKIFNRWGEVIYETNDIDQSWDGTFKGEVLNPGVYVYYLEGYCLNDETFIRTGNVTIIK